MSGTYEPPRGRRYARRGAPYVNPGLRISDADRTEVADRLSKHYGDGRLDQAEFNERLDRAMNAKTQADLDGLLADLPGDELKPPVRPQPQPRPHRPVARIAFLALMIVLAFAIGNALMHAFFVPWALIGWPVPWLLIGFVVFLWLRSRRSHRW